MRNKHIMLSPNQKVERLTSLIEDGKKFGFNPGLIKNYEKQLSDAEKEVQKISEQRKNCMKKNREFRKLNQERRKSKSQTCLHNFVKDFEDEKYIYMVCDRCTKSTRIKK